MTDNIEERRRRLNQKMTVVQRMNALFNGEPIDRIPLQLFGMSCGIGWFCAKNIGLPIEKIFKDPEKSFLAQLETQRQYGYDGIPILSYGSYGAWEFGGKIKFPTSDLEQAPKVISYPVKEKEDINRLSLPDVKKAGMLPLTMEFSRLQENRPGMPIWFPCGSPFTYAGNISSIDKLCRWVIREPESVHRLLRKCADHIIEVAQLWFDTFGPKRLIAHEILPFEANTVISKKHFEKFALPYLQEVHEKVLTIGIRRFHIHVCGQQKFNLSGLAKLPMGELCIASFGPEVTLTTAIEQFGENCVIAGTIDPTAIQNGTAQEVYDLSRKCIEEAKYAPRGFILAPGCDFPPLTPPENILAMIDAVLDFGWYN